MKISVITPNYNYSRFIGQTIQSVLDQNYSNFEHIIVDDGSTDNSITVIQEYVDKHPDKIRLIKQENKGQTTAINKGLELVSGDIIGWINSDDFYLPGAFNVIADTFSKNEDYDAIFGDIVVIDDKGHKIKSNRYLNFDYISGVFNGFGKIISSNAIFWKSFLTKEVGPFNENFKIGMDSEYWSRLLYKRKVQHINYAVAAFRWHEEAKTIKRQNKSNNEFVVGQKENIIVFSNSYQNLGISKILPAKYSRPIKYFYKIKRYFLRFIYGHYSR